MARRLRAAALAGASVLAALTTLLPLPATASAAPSAVAVGGEDLYLIAMVGPGTAGYRGPLSTADYRAGLMIRQQAVLTALDATAESRWTTALSGMSVRLDPARAQAAAGLPGVQLVQPDRVHQVAAAPRSPATGAPPSDTGRGGRGTVVGFVDTGIDAANPAFVGSTRLGPAPERFRGGCPQLWGALTCTDKVVGARYFVKAFGSQNLRAGASVSAHDDQGHGTMVASLAVGNQTTVAAAQKPASSRFSGIAPDARAAVYKACWEAPDPDQDGCASADVVAAIDQAVADRVDVLNLAIRGSGTRDVVALALLGAAESDIAVVAAAGNEAGRIGYQDPWVTAVGAATTGYPRGELRLGDGTRLRGLLTTGGTDGPRRVVAASSLAAAGASADEARICAPGSLDAGRAADRIVVCERGAVARLTKAETVRLAGGAAMVLVNGRGDELAADRPALPTLSVSAAKGRALRERLAQGAARGTIIAVASSAPARATRWSATGSRRAAAVKPDLLAPGLGVLAATSSATGRGRWDVLSGTSAAAAQVAGAAARVRARHPEWSQAAVRSALVGTAVPTAGDATLRQGAGVLDVDAAVAPGLVHDVAPGRYRRVLETGSGEVNQSALIVTGLRGSGSYRRTLTNVRANARYWSVRAHGFTGHRVSVRPVAVKVGAGAHAHYTITVSRLPGRAPATDDGWIVWRDARDNRVRVPVVIAR
ncbi:S8 family serine peptidase [Nocardioides dubius]